MRGSVCSCVQCSAWTARASAMLSGTPLSRRASSSRSATESPPAIIALAACSQSVVVWVSTGASFGSALDTQKVQSRYPAET